MTELAPEIVAPTPSSFIDANWRRETVTILCEGAICNHGISAEAREQALLSSIGVRRPLDARAIAHEVTMALSYQPHTWVAGARYRCLTCGATRNFG